MLVIADTSPLIVLTNIGHIHILPTLFGRAAIPPEVAAELANGNRPQIVRDFIARKPDWLTIQKPIANDPIPLLHSGELAAINLARELKADLLLIDEQQGRLAAAALGIRLTGTIGVLELAASAKLLDLQDAFERVKQTDFWISHTLLDERLRLFLAR
jgi:predicted nucleic acid-binding protein